MNNYFIFSFSFPLLRFSLPPSICTYNRKYFKEYRASFKKDRKTLINSKS